MGKKNKSKSRAQDANSGNAAPEKSAPIEPEVLEIFDGDIFDLEPVPEQRDFLLREGDHFPEYDPSEGPFYFTDPSAIAKIQRSKEGLASLPPTTVAGDFKAAATGKFANAIALDWEDTANPGVIKSLTWSQYYAEAVKAAKSFIALGVKQHDSVNIIGFNALPWHLSNMGAILAGGMAAGIYTTNGTEACEYIADHSGARVVVVENQKQLAKWEPLRAKLSNVTAYVVYADTVPEDANKDSSLPPVLSWEEFMAKGEDVADDTVEERITASRTGHCCTLIYTSGTTGKPKAVMISNDNATWTSKSLLSHINLPRGEEQHIVSFLPLSHIAAQILDLHAPIQILLHCHANCTVHFARPDALKGSLKETLVRVRPTLFFAVPRVWEKFAAAIQAIGASKGPTAQKISGWCKGKLLAAFETKEAGAKESATPWGTFAASLVLGAVPKALGLDRCKHRFTGAAPIGLETLKYFASLGMPVMELYGMSENTGPMTVSLLLDSDKSGFMLGATGPALPGCQMKIDHVADRGDAEGQGEICMRGRHIMMGYMKNEEKSKDAVDSEGWLHSGDLGTIDEFGFLHITGRIKELIITAGGENISPGPMEDLIKEKCPAVRNVVMIGDKKPYCTCLITLHLEGNDNDGWEPKLVAPSTKVNSEVTTPEEARSDEKWTAYIQAGLDYANSKAEKNASKIQKFRILATDFSVDGGELTSTLKLKRSVVHKMYEADIEAMYQDSGKKGGDSDKKKKKASA